MSTLHFISVSNSSVTLTHEILDKIHIPLGIHDLFPFIGFGENIYNNTPYMKKAFAFKDLIDSHILERIFLCVNPKFVSKTIKPMERIYLCGKIELRNHIEKLGRRTKVWHNMSVRDVFNNISGIAVLCPFINILTNIDNEQRDDLLCKIIEIMCESALSDIEKTTLFLGHNNGLMILSYLFEKIASKRQFSKPIYDSLEKLLKIIKEFYPQFHESFLESIFYNPEIWKYSSEEIQAKLREHMFEIFTCEKHDTKIMTNHIDIMLNFIEVYCNQQPIPSEISLNNMIGRCKQMCQVNLTRDTLFTLFGYANPYFIRRLNYHPSQIFYIVSIFLDLCQTSIFQANNNPKNR